MGLLNEELDDLREETTKLEAEVIELRREMSQLRKVTSDVATLAKLDMKNDILQIVRDFEGKYFYDRDISARQVLINLYAEIVSMEV